MFFLLFVRARERFDKITQSTLEVAFFERQY